jgi:P4 family phage/plasmid primase-like protien
LSAQIVDLADPDEFKDALRGMLGIGEPTANGKHKNGVLEQALELERLGFWVVAIHPAGAVVNDKIKTGKEPIGYDWGLQRRDDRWLRWKLNVQPVPGIGVCFGPGRGPGGEWLSDFEGDGPQAAESLAMLLGGGELATVGWASTRGGHNLFTIDGDRLLAALVAAGAVEGKGINAGVHKLAELPDLEIRIGGLNETGVPKQLQSVVPPTPGTDGKPREWTNPPSVGVAALPESAYAFLEALAEKKRTEAAFDAVTTMTVPRPGGPSVEDRAIAYLGTVDPAISGQGGSCPTFRAACVMARFDLPEHVALRLMLDHYNPKCVPPWSEAEMRHKVEDAYKKVTDRGSLLNSRGEQSRTSSTSAGAAASVKPKPPSDLDARMAKRPRTDLGNGERLVARFGANVRYCHPWRKWLHYDRQRWKADDTAAVHRLAKRTVRGILKEAATVEDDDERKAHSQFWHASEGKARVEAMLSCAASEGGIPILPDDMDRDGFLLNVENGTIDLRTGKLRPHQREDLITRLAPVKFLPDAKCPTWLRVLDDIFAKDEKLIAFWKMLCGICLTGDVSNQILPVLYGAGSNGKSTILTVMLEILGPDYAIAAPPGLLTVKKGERHPTEMASLFKKRLVVDSETAEGAQFNENLVKQLTGGDKISARRMREDFWEFFPTHKILMCTNHKPEIRETKNAIWRRVKLVPFNVAIADDKQDARLPTKLRGEYPGILAWCVQGCLDWQELGLDIPKAVEDATQEYRRESDIIGEFLASECTILPELRARATPLYARYQQWAGGDAVNQRKFGKAMTERGFEKSKNSVIEYSGVGLRADNTQANNRQTSEGFA